MKELEELKDKMNLVIKSTDKNEISEIIASLKKEKISDFFSKNIIDLNLYLKDSFELIDFRFHSLLTIHQTMIEISGLSLIEIQNKLSK